MKLLRVGERGAERPAVLDADGVARDVSGIAGDFGRLLARADDPVAERAALAARQPRGRLVAPEEVAAAIAYLASPAAGSVTGTALAADGGMGGLRLRPRS